jgi:hypothetical protein
MPPNRDQFGRFTSGGGSNSNSNEVVAWLEQFVAGFVFTRPGIEGSLGKDIIYKGAQCIADRSLTHRTGLGTAWPPNSETPNHWHEEGYRAWKKEHYGTGEPNSRTGQMLSQQSLRGRSTVEPHLVTMIYGTDTVPDRAVFGTPTENEFAQDQKVTDVQKAYFAHTGQSKQRIVRPFYALIDEDGAAIAELCQESLNDLIRETNTRNGY